MFRSALPCSFALALAASGCGEDGDSADTDGSSEGNGSDNGGSGNSNGSGNGSDGDSGDPGPPSAECRAVRLTNYAANADVSACGFVRTAPHMPEFVRVDRHTAAMAQAWWGSSYAGDDFETCGECWEITTSTTTEVVMVDDFCPEAGNEPCNGSQFHMDLSQQAAEAVSGGRMDSATARPIPCPVEGNIHIYVNDRNQWGFARLSPSNHRIPIRNVEYRAVDSDTWHPMMRTSGAWSDPDHAMHGNLFADGTPGVVLRLTSAQGQVVEATAPIETSLGIGDHLDLGAQFDDMESERGGTCEFTLPSDVYADAWGSYASVVWQTEPWGGASLSEVNEGCYDGDRCLSIPNFGGGFHATFRPAWAVDTFATLSMWVRSDAPGSLVVAPSRDGQRCTETMVDVTSEWSEVRIDVPGSCSGFDALTGFTVDSRQPTTVMLDAIRFE